MATTTPIADAAGAPAPRRRAENAGGNTTFGRVLRAEFTKFTTVPSTLVLILCTVAVMVGFAALGAWATGSLVEAVANDPEMAGAGPDMEGAADTLAASGVTFAQLIIGSLAVLVMSSEYATGMARATFSAVPRRYPVFLAKTLLVAVVSFVVAAASILLSFAVITPITEHYGIAQDFAGEAFQRTLWVASLYIMAVALIGFALGSLLRNSAGGIVSLAGLIFVLPIASVVIPGEVVANVRRFLPSEAVNNLMIVQSVPDALEKWQSALVLGAWVVVPLVIAGIATQRRDV
ncbi:ABC transporter permease [Arthrobacter halodurans]|uniref:ABC transporter permease n=1 Tax=Arthrobacter halodurans TaxID=516699 RepID=A0ABV4UIZ3_9MICC